MADPPRPAPAPARRAVAAGGGWTATDLALVAVFAALVAGLTLVPSVYPFGPQVPLTLQTLGVMLCGACLGAVRGAAAVLTYLAVGFAGLPVFAGYLSGFGVLSRPSAGFLLAFPVGAFVTGWLVQRLARPSNALLVALAAVVGGIAVVYVGGVAGLMVNGRLGLGEALVAVAPFLPGDLVKAVLTGVVAAAVHRAFPDLLPRRR